MDRQIQYGIQDEPWIGSEPETGLKSRRGVREADRPGPKSYVGGYYVQRKVSHPGVVKRDKGPSTG